MSDQTKKKDKTAKKPKAAQPAQPVGGNTLQQMQPMFNQAIFHKGNKKLDMSGNLRDTNAPTGLDWLSKFGPNRPEVAERRLALGRELRPDGGINAMAEKGRGAVEARKALTNMLPKPEPLVNSIWGDDTIGAVNLATKDGKPVGFSTQTKAGDILHQFSPDDVQTMLNKSRVPTTGTTPISGSLPFFGGGVEVSPRTNPENLTVRNQKALGERNQRQLKTQNEFYQPESYFSNLLPFGAAVSEQIDSQGGQAGNYFADLLGLTDKMPEAGKPQPTSFFDTLQALGTQLANQFPGPTVSAAMKDPKTTAKRVLETFVPTVRLFEPGVKAGSDWLSGLFTPQGLPPIRPDELIRPRQPAR